MDNPSKPGTAIVWSETLPVQDVSNFTPCRLQFGFLGPIRFFNIYGPSGSDKRQERFCFYSQEVFNALQLDTRRPLLLCGDFNAVVSPADIDGGFRFDQKNCPSLKQVLNVWNLVDILRFFYPSRKEFTFHRPGCAPSRLDRVYASNGLVENVSDVNHIASLGDHCAVHVKINMDISAAPIQDKFRNSYWK